MKSLQSLILAAALMGAMTLSVRADEVAPPPPAPAPNATLKIKISPGATGKAHLQIPEKMMKTLTTGGKAQASIDGAPMRTVIAGLALSCGLVVGGLQIARRGGRIGRNLALLLIATAIGTFTASAWADRAAPDGTPSSRRHRPPNDDARSVPVPVEIQMAGEGEAIAVDIDRNTLDRLVKAFEADPATQK